MGAIFGFFSQPILNLLVGFYNLFLYLHLPGAFGWAIILLTVTVRLALHPFFKQQIETSKKMQALKPHMDKLSAQHKKDPKRLQQEQMKLYKEAGINPMTGCLFMIIQIPIIYALYGTLNIFLKSGSNISHVVANVNKELYFPFLKISSFSPVFFGINLALIPKQVGGLYFAVPIITAALQFLQAQASIPPTPVEDPSKAIVTSGKDEKKADTSQDFQKAMNTQMKYVFPLLLGYLSYTLPVGLSLYWNIFSIFSIIQYRRIHKITGLK